MAIRVLIAEDSESIRKWYQYALGSISDIELLPMAKSGYEAVAFFAMHQPDVLILDMEMESRDAGLQAGYQVVILDNLSNSKREVAGAVGDVAGQEQRRSFGLHGQGVAQRPPDVQKVSGSQLCHGAGGPAAHLKKDDQIAAGGPADGKGPAPQYF